jgi:hypothetical protein
MDEFLAACEKNLREEERNTGDGVAHQGEVRHEAMNVGGVELQVLHFPLLTVDFPKLILSSLAAT